MKLEIRNRILQVALEALQWEDGFKVVTTESLSKDIGINKRTLYAYFKSKEDILKQFTPKNELEQAAFEEIFENISQNIGNRFLDEIKGLATIKLS